MTAPQPPGGQDREPPSLAQQLAGIAPAQQQTGQGMPDGQEPDGQPPAAPMPVSWHNVQQTIDAARACRAELDAHNRSWLHEPDADQLDFTLCVAVTAKARGSGEKLWGIVVGGSSSAKSEDLRMVFKVADARLGDLTAAGLISWMGSGEKLRVTGLLKRIPSPAFVVIEDLAPILADTADKRNRSKLVALLRKVYDGEVQRDLGGMPGQADWRGRVSMLAASTKMIDQQSALLDEGGPRWLLYRGREAAARTRLEGAGRAIDADARAKARAAAVQLATGVTDGGRAAFSGVGLTDEQAVLIGHVAVATGTLRGSVPRSGYGKREIEGITSTEEPWRLEAQLQLLARAAMAFGRSGDEAVLLARKTALGTVPPDRMRALEVLVGGSEHNASAIGRAKQMHRHVATRALEDLQQLQISDCSGGDSEDEPYAPRLWRIAETDIAAACRYVISTVKRHEK